MRRLGSIIAALLIAGLLAPALLVAPVAAAAPAVPKVVIVVGPVGGTTERYRTEARAAAEVARKYTPDVTEIYSPNATWPAVKKALKGASLVIYMGHGNGFPSRYRDSLYPPTQNGFGLNPRAGHQRQHHASVLRGEPRRERRPRQGRGRPAPPPVLRERPVRARARRGHPRPGEAARRQLRGRLHQGRGVRGHRGGVHEPVPLRGRDPGQQALDRVAVALLPDRQRQRLRLRERAQPRLRRDDGSRARVVRLRALDRAQGRARVRRRPGRRPRQRPRHDRRVRRPATRACRASTASGLRLSIPKIAGPTSTGRRADLKVPFKIRDRGRLPKVLEASVRWDPRRRRHGPAGGRRHEPDADPAAAREPADRPRSRRRRADGHARRPGRPQDREVEPLDGREPPHGAGPLPPDHHAPRPRRRRLRRGHPGPAADDAGPRDGRPRRRRPRGPLEHAVGRHARLAAGPRRQPRNGRVGPRAHAEHQGPGPLHAGRGRRPRRPLGRARRRRRS